MIGAATNTTDALVPGSEQAARCFDRLVSWRPPMEEDIDLLGMKVQRREALVENIGKALAYSITPSLDPVDISEERSEQLQAFYSGVGSFSTIIALPYFAGLNDAVSTAVGKIISKGIQGRTAHEVKCSGYALYKWKELAMAGKVPPPHDSLFSKMIFLIESGRTVGLHSLLWCAGELLKKNWLSRDDMAVLAACLPELFDAADYSRIRSNSREAVTASLIRETCVNLALDVMKVIPSEKLKEMIEIAKNDALPEVRFAAR